jgi:hypothetical protein
MATPIRSCLLLALSATATVWAQAERPLPDQAAFLQEVRSTLQSDQLLQKHYTYREKRTDVRRDDRGAEVGRTEKVFEVYPAPKGTEAYRRLISVDGVPSDGAKHEDADRAQLTAMLDRLRQIQSETPSQREKRLRGEAEDERDENEIVDDAFRLYSFHLTGRETLDGHETIAFTFTPVPGVTPRTSEGKLLQKFSGRAWVAERCHQLMRLEVESTDDVSFGFGLLARFYKGSQMVFQRRQVNETVWLPSELRYSGGGRVLLLKKLRVEGIREYSDYKAFNVETLAALSAPPR